MPVIKDKSVDRNARFAERSRIIRLEPAVSLTNGVIALIKPRNKEKVLGVDVFCRAITVDATVDLRLVGLCDLIIAGELAVDATAEKFKLVTTTAVFTIDGVVKTKAPATEITFTAAHKITALKHGAILVQVAANGTVSTKVAAATQAYNSPAEAVAALPAADASKVALGYILIEAGEADWDANTDDLTAESDLAAVDFVNYGVRAPLTDAIIPLAGQVVSGTLSEASNDVNIKVDDMIAVIATTDNDAALTDGLMEITTRPRTLRADVGD